MKKIRWQLLIAIGGIILLFGYLLGQSPIDEVIPPEPITGGVYREALIGMVSRLNPILDSYNQVDRDINRLLYRGLIQFDARGIPQPDLAESWAVSADATLYTFTIKSDALWHDNEPVQSDDVIYTFSKFQDPDYPGPADLHQLWSEVNIVRLGEKSIQFQLPEPYAPFIDLLSIGLLPEHLLRGVSAEELIDHPFNLQPIGNGPYQFSQFLLEDEIIIGIELESFPDYYFGQPFLNSIEFLFYADEGQALQAYLDEEVMGLSQVNQGILSRVLETPDLNLYSSQLPRMGIVFLNLNHPNRTFLSEKKFRHALMLAIKRQWLIDDVFSGQAVVADGPILRGTWAFLDQSDGFLYDTDAAEELLEEIGWEIPSGAVRGSEEYVRVREDQPLQFELLHTRDPLQTKIAQGLKDSWEYIGIQVELVSVQSDASIGQSLEERNFDAALTDLNFGRFPDPDPYPFWHDSQVETGQNYSGFLDRNIGIWLEKARTTPDLLTRTDLYKNFQYRFQDQLPALLLYSPIYNYAIDAQILGVRVGSIYDPSDRFASILEWHLTVGQPIPSSQLEDT
jgi:peptide/nickel transport system substrate-binding protein